MDVRYCSQVKVPFSPFCGPIPLYRSNFTVTGRPIFSSRTVVTEMESGSEERLQSLRQGWCDLLLRSRKLSVPSTCPVTSLNPESTKPDDVVEGQEKILREVSL